MCITITHLIYEVTERQSKTGMYISIPDRVLWGAAESYIGISNREITD